MAALAVGADVRNERADAMHDAHQVDIEHPAPAIELDVVDTATAGNTGIVANHVHVSERVICCLGGTLDTDRIGHIAVDAAHIRADVVKTLHRSSQCVRLDIGKHHLHARLRKGPPERETDTTGAARHECCLAGEFLHASPNDSSCC